jgi:SynChlorMet cassette protein ScmC
MWQALTPIYQKVLAGGGFPFHCGFVSRDGQGVLLAAPGNTGKSTCCRRIPPPWKALSDDEALIVLSSNRREYLVHPMPTWSNFMWKREGFATSWKAEAAVPLRAIFFLEQSETEAVEPLGQGQAAVFIHESALQVCRRGWRNLEADRERAFKKKVFENACDLSQRIPSFLLKVSLTGRFWKKMDQALFNGLAL